VGNFKSTTDYHYQTLRCNVDLLKIIQLGITFADENGNLPENVCTWQFHFKFNLQLVFYIILIYNENHVFYFYLENDNNNYIN